MSLETQEFLAGYLAEAQEHLASSGTNLVAIEEALRRNQPHPRAVRELFRSLHTLKGLSAMIGAEPVVDIAHEMETILRAADRSGGRLPPPAIERLVQGLRAIEERVGQLSRGEPMTPAPQALIEALAALEAPGEADVPARSLSLPPGILAKLGPAEREQLAAGIASGRRARRIEFVPSPERVSRGITITSVRERLGAFADIVKVVPRAGATASGAPAALVFVLLVLTEASDAQLAAAAQVDVSDVLAVEIAPEAAPAPAAALEALAAEADALEPPERGPQAFVRVDVSRLDEALEHLSALVVTRSRLERAAASLAQRGVDVRELGPVIQDYGRQLRDLRGAIMGARLVRISQLLERAPLTVRGLARSTGKRVRLTIDAGAAEVDKSVGERLLPAILHLLRNAVDHAIETPEERRRAGKPEEGHVRVSARERSDSELELVVADDGRGIDRAEVARRAGAPVPETDAALLELVSRPGLSTVDAATRTSGRGLGVDIVRRIAVRELGGELRLETSPGAGTTFTLRVPLSLTIVEALAFACGGERFVVPLAAVEDLVEIDPAALVPAPAPRRGGPEVRLLRRRDASVPIVRLDAVLGMAAAGGARPKAIVVRREGEAFAFEVDRMLGRQEVVVRPLADPLVRAPGVMGSTDLGDGHPTLVLDLVALTRTLGGAPPETA